MAFRIHFWTVRSASFALFEGHANAALNAPSDSQYGSNGFDFLGGDR